MTDNPPAFPTILDYGGKPVTSQAGMALRDFFAAMVIAGMQTSGSVGRDYESDARIAYRAADAMLQARAKG